MALPSGTHIIVSIPKGKQKADKPTCFARSTMCTGNHELNVLEMISSTMKRNLLPRHREAFVHLLNFLLHLCHLCCQSSALLSFYLLLLCHINHHVYSFVTFVTFVASSLLSSSSLNPFVLFTALASSLEVSCAFALSPVTK